MSLGGSGGGLESELNLKAFKRESTVDIVVTVQPTFDPTLIIIDGRLLSATTVISPDSLSISFQLGRLRLNITNNSPSLTPNTLLIPTIHRIKLP